MPLSHVAWLAAGVLLLYFGAEGFVRGASSLALRVGLAPLAVGLTVVAFGTSGPELAVSIDAARTGLPEVAVGNVVGSNVANVALILGLSALIRPMRVEAKLIRLDVPLVILLSVLAALLLADGTLGRPEAAVLVAIVVGYTAFSLIAARRERPPGLEDALRPGRHPLLEGALLVGGLGLLVLGADRFVVGATELGRVFGLDERVIGLTIVAVGTSLPELATSVVAAIRGHGDISVGNVIGSNIFNLAGILGVAGLVSPLARGGVSGWDLGVMIAAVLLLLPLMRTGFRLSRREGAVLLTAYVAYMAWLLV